MGIHARSQGGAPAIDDQMKGGRQWLKIGLVAI
jgi:hypothetical protein